MSSRITMNLLHTLMFLRVLAGMNHLDTHFFPIHFPKVREYFLLQTFLTSTNTWITIIVSTEDGASPPELF